MKRFAPLVALALTAVLAGCGPSTVTTAETDETIHNWALARNFQAQGRYELAKQYYSLALSSVRTQSALDTLSRELGAVDLQLRTMR